MGGGVSPPSESRQIRFCSAGLLLIVGCSTGTGPGDQLPADPLLIETIAEGGTTRNDFFTIRPDGSDRRAIWSEVRGFGYSTLFVRYSFDRTRIAFFQPGTPVIKLRDRQGADLGSIAVGPGRDWRRTPTSRIPRQPTTTSSPVPDANTRDDWKSAWIE